MTPQGIDEILRLLARGEAQVLARELLHEVAPARWSVARRNVEPGRLDEPRDRDGELLGEGLGRRCATERLAQAPETARATEPTVAKIFTAFGPEQARQCPSARREAQQARAFVQGEDLVEHQARVGVVDPSLVALLIARLCVLPHHGEQCSVALRFLEEREG